MKVKSGLICAFLGFCSLLQGQYLDSIAFSNMVLDGQLNINTKSSEFSPLIIEGRLVYVTEGDEDKEKDKNLDERYWDLRSAVIDTNGQIQPQEFLSDRVNSPYHEGPACFDNRDSSLYFTRDNFSSGKLRKGNEERVYLQIFRSKRSRGIWSPAKALVFNNKDFNICHPTLIPNQNKLIFSSNMPGGFGKMDLYEISLNATSIEEAVNLGPEINSEGNEIFPFYHPMGYLFFSSEIGTAESKNLELFVSRLSESYEPAQQLLGHFSSDKDDLGIYITDDGMSGYFSSNRSGSKGKDDIYSFSTDRPIFKIEEDIVEEIIEQIIEEDLVKKAELIILLKGNDLQSLSNVDLDVFLLENDSLVQTHNQVSETVVLNELDQGKDYRIEVRKTGYFGFIKTVYEIQEVDELLIILEKEPQPIVVEEPKEIIIPETVGEIVVFENIYYAYNSDVIKDGSADELDALVRAMKRNPNMEVRLVAHTDSRGSDEYNKDLSLRRANSAKNYLIRKRISADRISTLGVGESQIRNHCRDGVRCSDRAHRYNRRTEVQIVKQ